MFDDLDRFAQVTAGETDADLARRVERQRRLQRRARRVRRTCRYVVLLAGIPAVVLCWYGPVRGSTVLSGLGCCLMLPTLIAGIVLFFMGGLAPGRVRLVLTERERRRLDE